MISTRGFLFIRLFWKEGILFFVKESGSCYYSLRLNLPKLENPVFEAECIKKFLDHGIYQNKEKKRTRI